MLFLALGRLPNEIWLMILEYCDFVSCLLLHQTCRTLHNLSSAEIEKKRPYIFLVESGSNYLMFISLTRAVGKMEDRAQPGKKLKLILTRIGKWNADQQIIVDFKNYKYSMSTAKTKYILQQVLPVIKTEPPRITDNILHKTMTMYENSESGESIVIPVQKSRSYWGAVPVYRIGNCIVYHYDKEYGIIQDAYKF